jgi:hypothetical protein
MMTKEGAIKVRAKLTHGIENISRDACGPERQLGECVQSHHNVHRKSTQVATDTCKNESIHAQEKAQCRKLKTDKRGRIAILHDHCQCNSSTSRDQ